MKLYSIYWYDIRGIKFHLVITNDIEKWLEENNKRRISEGEVPEKLHDFEIQEVTASIYSEEE